MEQVDGDRRLTFGACREVAEARRWPFRHEPGSGDDRSRYLPLALDVLTLRDRTIAGVTAFRTPEVFDPFGLPAELRAPEVRPP